MNISRYPVESGSNNWTPLTISFTAGATGAVGTVTDGLGFRTTTPIVRNGVGDYTTTLVAPCAGIFGGFAQCIGAADATAGKVADIISNLSTTTGAIRWQFARRDTGAAADPASTDVVKFTVFVQR